MLVDHRRSAAKAGSASHRPLLLEVALGALLAFVPIAGTSIGRGEIGSPSVGEVAAKLAVVLVLLFVVSLLGTGKLPASLSWRLLFGFPVLLVVAAPLGIAPATSLVDGGLLLGATLVAGMCAADIGARRVIRAVAIGSTLLVLVGFFVERRFDRSTANRLDADGLFGSDRVAGLLVDPNTMGQTAAVGILAAVLLFAYFRTADVAIICGACCALGLAMSQSRTALIGLLVALAVGLVRARFARAMLLLGLALILAVLLALPGAEAFGTESLTRSGDANEVATLTGRTKVWKAVLTVVPDHPVVGHGAGTSPVVLSELIREGRVTWPALHAHNGMLQVLLTGGIVGLGLVVSSVAMWLAGRRNDRRLDPFVWLVIIGTLTEVLVMRTPSTYWMVLVAVVAVPDGNS